MNRKMNRLRYLCLVVSLSVILARFFPHCPVTSSLDLTKNGSYYYYPIDFYEPPELFEKERNDSIVCKTYDLTCPPVHPGNHLCTKEARFCPVTKTNIHEALMRTKSPVVRSSICLIKEKLMKYGETVNFYVSGGSVSVGMNADECCSAPECAYTGQNHIMCTWSYQLYLWMNRTFPANINYINFADHGKTSELMVDNMKSIFHKFNIVNFTSNDLIFLDHSVNDNEAGGVSIANGLESLIRHLYFYSVPHDWPTLIVLDADPKIHKQFPTMNYSDTYERISRFYDIPVWSYHDAVLSNYSRIVQKQYSPFLVFDKNAGTVTEVGTHPPWHVHWFMADLYADIMLNEMKKYCSVENKETDKLYLENLRLRNRTYADLPVPQSANATIDECGNEVLDFDYISIENNLPVVGKYEFVPPVGGWRFGTDKPGRPGGFLVDNSSVDDARVVFTLNITTKEFVANKGELQFIIQYLRSYDNGGIAQVKFCGQMLSRGVFGKWAGFLDGLWPDYETHRFSLPDKWSPDSKKFSYTFCEKFEGEHPIIDLTFRREPSIYLMRGNQKVKILSISACLV